MRGIFWLVLLGSALAVGWLIWYSRRRLETLRRAEDERVASFLAQTAGRPRMVEALSLPEAPAAPAAPATENGLPQQKLLFEAAHKAGEAGEPALAIQLFARLLARYPASGFAAQARAEVAAQKKKLSKA